MDINTMSRTYKLELKLLELISKQEDGAWRDEPLDYERLHLASCARVAWCMALKRGVEPELAASAAAIHDIGRIVTGRQAGHAQAGAEPARELLSETGLFSDIETDEIVKAVANHSSKTVVGTALEEIVKDADVVDCYQYGMPFDRPEKEPRYKAWFSDK